jgi:DNA-binding MarR family transcriptional regulator
VDSLYHSARAVESSTGLTNAQLAVLRLVARHGPLTVNEVTARMHAGQSAMSTLLARLAAAGLIRRSTAPDDRRRVLVSVTAAGRRKIRGSPRPPTERLLAAVDRLTPAEADRLADSLGRLLGRMRAGRRSPMLFD